MPPPKYSAEDSELVSDLLVLSKKSPRLVKSSVYPAPAAPNTLLRSWKLNEFKYYDIPSPFPTLARGLFTTEIQPESAEEEALGTVKHRIVARGYDKFFNIGEVPWTTWAALETHTKPPYTLSLKSNGCIIFIAALTSEKLLVTSKHSLGPIQGVDLTHAQAGEQWLRKYLKEKGKTEADLAKKLWDENWTAIAELCDDSFEEHVLPYPPELTGLHLHGLNVSTESFVTMPHTVVDAFAEEWGFIKTRTHTVNSVAEVRAFTDHVSSVGEWEGEAVEGFVVRTHVSEPPTEGRGSSKAAKGQSPYTPGSSFFFKVKFDEPYMMYRDWREVTKSLLTAHSKGQKLTASLLPKAKMKRKETKVYVKWVIDEIKKNRAAFDGYAKGHGIIRNRERFLKWFHEQQEAKGGMTGVEDIESAEEEEQQNKELEGAIDGDGRPAKVIIVPIAIPGCGKTSVALALAHLFGWGHTQSDDVKAKKSAPVFLRNVDDLLKKHDVVIADKNNHLKVHRSQLQEVASSFTPRARLVALNWSFSHLPPSTAHKICTDRILDRGTNHQTLVPSDLSAENSHEEVLWMFINQHEELTSSEVETCIDLELAEDTELEDMVGVAVDGLFKTKILVGPGGALEGVEKPDAGRIREVVRDVVEQYKVGRNVKRERANQRDKEKAEKKKKQKEKEMEERRKKEEKKGKPPRYFGVLPDLDIHSVLDSVFQEQHPQNGGSDGTNEGRFKEGAEFWETLKKNKRVADIPHITIVHEKNLPEEQNTWDKSTSVYSLSEDPPSFQCKIGRVLWDGRVMSLVVDELRLAPSTASLLQSSEGGASREAGEKFLDALPQETKNRLHVTVGTAKKEIMPVEGKTLVERWREGQREEEGVFGVEFEGEGVVVEGKLRGLWA